MLRRNMIQLLLFVVVAVVVNSITDLNRTGCLLEVVNDFGLLVQLPDVHHPLGELSASCVDDLVPEHHLPPGINRLLLIRTQPQLSGVIKTARRPEVAGQTPRIIVCQQDVNQKDCIRLISGDELGM